VLIPLVTWNNLLERLNPAVEPFNSPSFFIQYRIEPAWPSPLRVCPGSRVGRDIPPDPSSLVVLTDLLGIVGCICGDDRGMHLHLQNRKRFNSWFIELGIMDICREDGAGKRKTVPIDQST